MRNLLVRLSVFSLVVSFLLGMFEMQVYASGTYTTLQGVSWTMGDSHDDTFSDATVQATIESEKANIEYIWGFLRANGFTEVAAAAILGNFWAESGWKCTASEGGMSDGKDGRGLAQWTTVGTGGAGTGCHRALSDFAVASNHRHKSGTPQYASEGDNTWLSCMECQMNFFISDPSFGNKSMCSASGWGGVAPGITNLVTFGSFDFLSYKSGNAELAVREATESFCLRWEVPAKSTCRMQNRVQYAVAIYKKYTGTTIDAAAGTMTGADGTVFTITGNLAATYNEEYFLGLQDSLHDSGVLLPDASSLQFSEQQEIAEWKNTIELLKEDKKYSILRAIVMLVGIIMIVYSTLLFIAFQIDRINNFVDVELVSWLTGNKLVTSRDETSTYNNETAKGKPKTVVQKDIFAATLTGILAGVLLLSGKLYAIINLVVSFVQSVF